MKFVDLKKENNYFNSEIKSRIKSVFDSGRYLFGEQLKELEKNFSEYIGVRNAVAVKNCTDAIILLLRRLCEKDTIVILPNFGAYPTAVAVKNVTNNIYYVDVDKSMTIDVHKLPKHIKNGIIIPVHLFGNKCNMEKIMQYATNNRHVVIEDCAQATGLDCGKDGHYSVFSFYPTKPLASVGDGGMICSDRDLSIYKKIRFYGQYNGTIEYVGINSRMDEIQCGIVNAKLLKFEELNEKRITTAFLYKKIIKGIHVNSKCVYHQFTVLFKNREKILKKLDLEKIPYMIHYPLHVSEIPVLQGIYNDVNYRVNNKIVSLPCHPFLKDSDIEKIKNFLVQNRKQEYV